MGQHVGPARQLDERLLHRVGGVEAVAAHALAVAVDAIVVGAHGSTR
jgi:nucleotide-binding universal stress UspA family protein